MRESRLHFTLRCVLCCFCLCLLLRYSAAAAVVVWFFWSVRAFADTFFVVEYRMRRALHIRPGLQCARMLERHTRIVRRTQKRNKCACAQPFFEHFEHFDSRNVSLFRIVERERERVRYIYTGWVEIIAIYELNDMMDMVF